MRPSNLAAAGLCIDVPRIPAGSRGGERLCLGVGGSCVASCSLVLDGARLGSPRESVRVEGEEVGSCPLVHTQVLLLRSDGSFTLFVPLVFILLL